MIADIFYIICVFFAIAWGILMRQKAKAEQATEKLYEIFGLLMVVALVLIPTLSLSPFHLLWMFPVSFLLGTILLQFRLFWPLASLYGSLWYIGTKNPGRAYYLSGDYAKAIEAFKETILLKPNSADAHFNLGLAYGKLGDKQKELKCYKEAVRLKPNLAEVHCNIGFIYKDSGNKQRAIESFREAIRIRPDYAKAHGNIGLCYIEIGDRENALKKYKLLQKLDKELSEELHVAISAMNN